MKTLLSRPALIIIALTIMIATLVHGSIADISIFHGFILHPIFLLAGIFLLALYSEKKHRA